MHHHIYYKVGIIIIALELLMSCDFHLFFCHFIQVIEFCDKNSHNAIAANMQNKFCDYRSTWEVIMNSTDISLSPPMNTPPPAPTVSFLQTQDRVLCLVLDVSGSMIGVSLSATQICGRNIFIELGFPPNDEIQVNLKKQMSTQGKHNKV